MSLKIIHKIDKIIINAFKSPKYEVILFFRRFFSLRGIRSDNHFQKKNIFRIN